jgi:hypothetical protein
MRIDSKEKIADVAILKVRDFLRRVNNTDEWEDFSSFLDRLEWPEHEVRLFLKSSSRTLSIHSIHDEILNRVEYRVLFQNNKVR